MWCWVASRCSVSVLVGIWKLTWTISLISSGFYGSTFRACGQPVWSLLWADAIEFACATALQYFFIGYVNTISDFQIQWMHVCWKVLSFLLILAEAFSKVSPMFIAIGITMEVKSHSLILREMDGDDQSLLILWKMPASFQTWHFLLKCSYCILHNCILIKDIWNIWLTVCCVAECFTVIFQCGHELLNIRNLKGYLTMDECGWSLTHVPCNHFFIVYKMHVILLPHTCGVEWHRLHGHKKMCCTRMVCL